jgi:hypothetical protein
MTALAIAALHSGSPSSCTPLYTPVVTRPIPGARPFGASLTLFKIVPDDFVATVRLAPPALVTFLKQLLNPDGSPPRCLGHDSQALADRVFFKPTVCWSVSRPLVSPLAY